MFINKSKPENLLRKIIEVYLTNDKTLKTSRTISSSSDEENDEEINHNPYFIEEKPKKSEKNCSIQ